LPPPAARDPQDGLTAVLMPLRDAKARRSEQASAARNRAEVRPISASEGLGQMALVGEAGLPCNQSDRLAGVATFAGQPHIAATDLFFVR
jgi:hypothetical protein